jgi:hypothetical protein
MADNTRLNSGTAGDLIRNIDKGGVKTQVVTLDLGGSGVESLTSGTLPVSGTVEITNDVGNPVPVSGTVATTQTNGYTTGTLTAAAQAITVTVPDGHSSWTVYLRGTFSSTSQVAFEGSPDGTNWHALNGRRNTDAATNETTNFVDANPFGGPSPTGSNPSNWRGVIGGIRFFRVRCAVYTALDAIAVQIVTSPGVGATFLNVGLPASNNLIGFTGIQYAFQAAVGRAFGVTTGRLTMTVAATAQNSIVIYNPVGSGKNIFIYRINTSGTYGANNVGQFDRFRFVSATAPTGGQLVTPVNRNGDATASIAQVRRGTVSLGTLTGVTVTGTLLAERSLLQTSGGDDPSDEQGSLIITPGSGILQQVTTTAAASISNGFAWHEL